MLKVYYLKISDCVSISEQYLLEKVGKNTRKEVSTYSNEQVRRQKCLGEAMCRELIETLWTLQPEAYAIVRTEHGKPMVQGVPAVYFNLSHSGDYIVCAVSDQEVGIDIQQMGKGRLSLAERYFHPNEVVQLKQATAEEQGLLFYRYWAAKESFLKYIGTGLSGSLSAFEILFTEETIRVKNNKLLQEPHLWSIEITPNYQCCLCATSAERPECSPFHF